MITVSLNWMILSIVGRLYGFKVITLTPVAGPILHGGNLSPNLQNRFCELCPAHFLVAIYLFVCS